MRSLDVPVDLVRLTSILTEHQGEDAVVDSDHPSIEIWVVEEDGELYRWLLVAIGERTVTVMRPRDRHHRELRKHQHVWVRPHAFTAWRKTAATGYRRQERITWTREQGERGRQNALARRMAEAAEA